MLPSYPQGGKVLVWFRSDLRVHDNPALTHALEEAGTVVPVYCFDPRQFGKTSFGFEKTGTFRVVLLCHWPGATIGTPLYSPGARLQYPAERAHVTMLVHFALSCF